MYICMFVGLLVKAVSYVKTGLGSSDAAFCSQYCSNLFVIMIHHHSADDVRQRCDLFVRLSVCLATLVQTWCVLELWLL